MNIEHDILVAASEAFLCEALPSFEVWESMVQEDKDEFLTSNAWGLLVEEGAEGILNLIDCHADTIKRVISDSLYVLKEKLIEAAIECELPSDFNELDLHTLLYNTESELAKGSTLSLGDSVLVVEPRHKDSSHHCEFQGTVTSISRSEGTCLVIDQDDNVFTVALSDIKDNTF